MLAEAINNYKCLKELVLDENENSLVLFNRIITKNTTI